MNGEQAAALHMKNRHFLQNVLKGFSEADGDFRPVEGMMTVAQQIRHIAMATEWFYDGGLDDRWALDFEAFEKANHEPVTFAEAMRQLDATTSKVASRLGAMTAAQLGEPMKDNPILGPVPRSAVICADGDHMAHHRGVLTVYQRLLGRVPTMVYAD